MKVLVLLWLVLSSGPLAAQTVAVRSGDHDTFSRLVIPIKPGTTWEVFAEGRVVRLVLPELGQRIDTANVLSRLPSGRIIAIAGGQGSVQLSLGCECLPETFLWRPDRLVLDILDPDGKFDGDEVFDPQPQASQSVQMRARVAFPLFWRSDGPTAQIDALPDPFRPEPPIPALPADVDMSNFQASILESLGRAMTEGTIEVPRPATAEPGRIDPLSAVETQDEVADVDGGSAPSTSPGLRIRSARDPLPSGEGAGIAAKSGCIPDGAVDVDTWAGGKDFSDRITQLRRNLVTELDAYQEAVVLDLARSYLHFGFGLEALEALGHLGGMTAERELLAAMAQVIDRPNDTPTLLADQIHCEGEIVLWAALAKGQLSEASDPGRNAVVLAFQGLPPPLRQHLGPRVASLFLEFGAADTADLVLRSSGARLDNGDIDSEIAELEVTVQIGDPEVAINNLSHLAERDPRMTSVGLSTLMELVLAKGGQVEPAILELSEALRFELGPTEEAAELAGTEVLARLKADNFDAAFALAEDESIPFSAERRKEIKSEAAIAVSRRGDDAAFLSYAFKPIPEDLSFEAESAISARLITLGFPEAALNLLSRSVDNNDLLERRFQRAEAAARLGDVASVSGHLEGLTDPRANRIRAEALTRAGNDAGAADQQRGALDSSLTSEQTWRRGDGTQITQSQDPLIQGAARAAQTPSTLLPIEASLAERRALLEESEQARALTMDLLERFAIDPLSED